MMVEIGGSEELGLDNFFAVGVDGNNSVHFAVVVFDHGLDLFLLSLGELFIAVDFDGQEVEFLGEGVIFMFQFLVLLFEFVRFKLKFIFFFFQFFYFFVDLLRILLDNKLISSAVFGH